MDIRGFISAFDKSFLKKNADVSAPTKDELVAFLRDHENAEFSGSINPEKLVDLAKFYLLKKFDSGAFLDIMKFGQSLDSPSTSTFPFYQLPLFHLMNLANFETDLTKRNEFFSQIQPLINICESLAIMGTPQKLHLIVDAFFSLFRASATNYELDLKRYTDNETAKKALLTHAERQLNLLNTKNQSNQSEEQSSYYYLIGMAWCNYLRENFRVALRFYRMALQSGYKNLNDARFGIGMCQFKLGNYSDAEQAFFRVIQVDPTNVKALTCLSVILLNYGHVDSHRQAFLLLRRAYKIEPTNLHCLRHLSNYFFFRRQYKESLFFGLKGIEAAGKEHNAKVLAELHYQVGRVYHKCFFVENNNNNNNKRKDYIVKAVDNYIASVDILERIKHHIQTNCENTAVYFNLAQLLLNVNYVESCLNNYNFKSNGSNCCNSFSNYLCLCLERLIKKYGNKDCEELNIVVVLSYICDNVVRQRANTFKRRYMKNTIDIDIFQLSKTILTNILKDDDNLDVSNCNDSTKFQLLLACAQVNPSISLKCLQLAVKSIDRNVDINKIAELEKLVNNNKHLLKFEFFNNLAIETAKIENFKIVNNLLNCLNFFELSKKILPKSKNKANNNNNETLPYCYYIMYNIGCVYEKLGRLTQAETQFTEILSHIDKMGRDPGMAYLVELCIARLIIIYAKIKNYEIDIATDKNIENLVNLSSKLLLSNFQNYNPNAKQTLPLLNSALGFVYNKKKYLNLSQECYESTINQHYSQREQVFCTVELGNIWLTSAINIAKDPLTKDGKKIRYLERAANFYKRALNMDNGNQYAANGMGCVMALLNKTKEAMAIFNSVREASSTFHSVFMNLGNCLLLQRQYLTAIQVFKAVLPQLTDAKTKLKCLLSLSKCYYQAKRFSDAKQMMLKARRVDPTDKIVLLNYGIVLRRCGQVVLNDPESRFDEIYRAVYDIHTSMTLFEQLLKEKYFERYVQQQKGVSKDLYSQTQHHLERAQKDRDKHIRASKAHEESVKLIEEKILMDLELEKINHEKRQEELNLRRKTFLEENSKSKKVEISKTAEELLKELEMTDDDDLEDHEDQKESDEESSKKGRKRKAEEV